MRPENKTPANQLLKLPFDARELAQIQRNAGVPTKSHPNCICCVAGIIALNRGNQSILCADMPWACPVRTNLGSSA